MKIQRTAMLVAFLATLGLVFAALTCMVTPSQAGYCGPVPPRPPTPPGCRQLCPQCQCDARGIHCAWVWVCCG